MAEWLVSGALTPKVGVQIPVWVIFFSVYVFKFVFFIYIVFSALIVVLLESDVYVLVAITAMAMARFSNWILFPLCRHMFF